MLNFLAVFLGGGLGSISRYAISILYTKNLDVNLPLATLSVNFIGSFLIGAFLAFFAENATLNPSLKMAMTVGFCGGLTTFSTFSFEMFDMLKRGEFLMAFLYALISCLACVGFAAIGFYWAKSYV